jgi:hypothetical protein
VTIFPAAIALCSVSAGTSARPSAGRPR